MQETGSQENMNNVLTLRHANTFTTTHYSSHIEYRKDMMKASVNAFWL